MLSEPDVCPVALKGFTLVSPAGQASTHMLQHQAPDDGAGTQDEGQHTNKDHSHVKEHAEGVVSWKRQWISSAREHQVAKRSPEYSVGEPRWRRSSEGDRLLHKNGALKGLRMEPAVPRDHMPHRPRTPSREQPPPSPARQQG